MMEDEIKALPKNPSRSASAGGEPARACSFTWPASLHAASHGFTPNLSLHVRLLQEANPASLPAASHGFTCRLLQLPCRLSAFSHAAGGAGEAGLATWVGWYMGNFGFIGLSDEEEAFAINLWNNRFDWLPEDCTPIEGNNFNCSPEYTEWFNNNGKPFLVAHEVSQRWHTEQRCSYQHVGETFEPEQNWHQSPNNGVMDLNIEWSTWESRTEPIRPVVGSSSSSNPWEEPIYNYPTVGETTYQHTQVSSSEPRNVFEQPHVQTNFGASSSSYACHDDDVYRPQFDYPQPSTYGQSMCVDSVTCWLSTTTISTPSFAQDMYSTPPPMQTMDDQLNQDEQTPDLLHQRRIVNPPRRYDQTSSLHRQVLPRRKG
ncbi:hypothetical protein V6N13_105438 [Hibiscus sabdariffa]